MIRPWRRKEVIGGQTLYLGDCMEVMPVLGRFDAVVTDPPYGIGEGALKTRTRQRSAKSKALADQRKYVGAEWDDSPATASHIAAMIGISKHQIIFGGNYFEGLGPTTCWLVWDKQNGSNDFADCELAWTNMQKAVRRICWRWNGMIRKGDDVREHPTQKPLGVMKWCIEHLPKDAKTILDPFMGSGTTLVACQRLGRSGVGIELDPDYFQIACDRVQKAVDQPDLFIETPTAAATQETLI